MEKYPEANLKTYIVWFNMVATDTRGGWKPDLLSDKRAMHYWDADQEVGRWIADNVTTCKHLGPIAWDSFYLFDAEASWEETLGPIQSCGTPVFRATEDLSEALAAMLKQ